MLFYIIILFLVLISTKSFDIKKVSNGFGYCLASFILILVAILRFDVGWDYQSYYTILDEEIKAGYIRFEPLSLLISFIAMYFNMPSIFFILSGLIMYVTAFYAFKRFSVSPSISLIVYVGLFYLISLSIIRQALAISVCIYAYRYVISHNFKKYFICIIVATLFHYSAIISLIVYPIFHRFKIKTVILYIILAVFTRTIILYLLEYFNVFSAYLEKIDDIEGGKFTRVFYLLILISFFLLVKRKTYNEYERKHISIILVGLACPFLFGAMGERVGYYFLIYYCYLIPLLVHKKTIEKRIIYVMIFSLYFISTIYITSNIEEQKSAYTPYRTIFTADKYSFKY